MEPGIVIPVGGFAVIVLVVWLVQHFSLKRRVEMLSTLRLAIEKGQAVTPEVMESMARISSPIADLRRGIIFLAIAAGFAAFTAMISQNAHGDMIDVSHGLYGVAMLPLFIGVAFLGLHFFANESKRR